MDSARCLIPQDILNSAVASVEQMMMLKMLHSRCKEFITGHRLLGNLKGGKCADVDVALRAKLKTYASEKHVPT